MLFICKQTEMFHDMILSVYNADSIWFIVVIWTQKFYIRDRSNFNSIFIYLYTDLDISFPFNFIVIGVATPSI